MNHPVSHFPQSSIWHRFETLSGADLLELSNVPISPKSRREIAEILRKVFCWERTRSDRVRLVRYARNGRPKAETRRHQELLKGPFEDYAFSWNTWRDYLLGIFERWELRFAFRFEEIRRIFEEDPETITSTRGCEELTPESFYEAPQLFSQYVGRLRSFLIFLVAFLENRGVKNSFVFEEYVAMAKELEEIQKHPAFILFTVWARAHTLFAEIVTAYYLEDRQEDIKEAKKCASRYEREIWKVRKDAEKTTSALREAIAQRVQENLSASASHMSELTIFQSEARRLREILCELGYDPNGGISPKDWVSRSRKESVRQAWAEWEALAMEEAARADEAEKRNRSSIAYVAYLESCLKKEPSEIAEPPRKAYLRGRWKSGEISLDERFECLGLVPDICPRAKTFVTDSIAHIKCRIGGTNLSSTNHKLMGPGSGYVANRLASVLGFLSDRIAEGRLELLSLSWKEIVRQYFDSTGHRSTNEFPFFTLLIHALPEKPGNLSDFETLAVALRSIEGDLKWRFGNDLKNLCIELSSIFSERMSILERQFANGTD